MKIRVWPALVLLTAPMAASPTSDAWGQQTATVRYAPRKVIPIGMRPITDAKIVTADEAEIADNELILGVEIAGQARAYPINQLTGPTREIFNDTLAGTPIAATW